MQVAGIDLSDRLRSLEQATQHRLLVPGAPSSSAARTCLFLSQLTPNAPQTSWRHTGRSRVCLPICPLPPPLLRTPHPDQLLWVAIVTPAGAHLQNHEKACYAIFSGINVFGGFSFQIVRAKTKSLFSFLQFCRQPRPQCRYWVYLGWEPEWSRSL